jgi:hypothetical protein
MLNGFKIVTNQPEKDPDSARYEVWVTIQNEGEQPKDVRYCQHLDVAELEGILYGLEIAEQEGPLSVDNVRAFRAECRRATGLSF